MDLVTPLRPPRLADWEARPFSPGVERGPRRGDHRDAFEGLVAREPPGDPAPHGPHRRVAAAILSYRVFPSWLITGVLRRAPVEVGDTVGIHAHAGPWLGLFFAARVVARFDGPEGGLWRTGFTYRTLEGHVEHGQETFVVEKDLRRGTVLVALRSWSRPGTPLTRALTPVLRLAQVRGNRAAVANLAAVARRGPRAGRRR